MRSHTQTSKCVGNTVTLFRTHLRPVCRKAAFLSVLDKYTALGVYLIHHTFTLAELFAQSGFYLADQSIKAGLSAADESVRVIDGMFGSNETSRALSSFITMVKSELSGDEMLTRQTGGGIWTIAALTKALTTFAVLQNATFRRTAKTQKTRVLYDCLVLGEAETKSWRAQIVGPGNFIKRRDLPALPAAIPPRISSSHQAPASSRTRLLSSAGSIRSGMSSIRRSRSIFGVDEPCITDVQETETAENLTQYSSDLDQSSAMLLDDLDYLVGAEEEDDEDDGAATPSNRIIASSEFRHEDLPRDMKDILSRANSEELEKGLVLQNQGTGGSRPREVRRVVRQKSRGGIGGTAIYEITTETTEVIEETTTTVKQSFSKARKDAGVGNKMKRLPNPFGAFKQEREQLSSPVEDDWFAVESGPREATNAASKIPELPNGRSAASSVAATSRRETLSQPEESRQRVQEVVRTITKRLIQRKRVIRQVQVQDASSDENEGDTSMRSTTPSPQTYKRKGSETPRSAISVDRSLGAQASNELGSSLQRALGKAKTSFTSGQSGRQTLQPSDANQTFPVKIPGRMGKMDHKVRNKELPDVPSMLSSEEGGGVLSASMRRKRRSRAGSIGSIRSFASHSHSHVQSTTTTKASEASQEEGPNGAPGNFPKQHLVKNLRRFMRHSSAAYGQNFMRVLGIGDTQYLFADTRERSANIFSYAHHVGISPDAVLLSSYCEGASLPFHSEKMAPIVNYISRDDVSKAIVLTCRGTLGLSDVLTDLTCSFVDVQVEDGKAHHSYQVHSGMLASAQRLAAPGHTVLEKLKTALEMYPDYGLVLTGHSLGGGVACLLAMQLSSPAHAFQTRMMDEVDKATSIRHPKITTPFVTGLDSGLPPGRPIHAYAYGPPAVASPDLSRYCKGLCTSVIHGFDVVPTLSLGTLHDLKAVACSLSDEKESTMAQEIVGRVVGLYQRKKRKAKERIESSARPMLHNDAGGQDDDGDDEMLRPMELPSHERNLHLNVEELAQGRTKNRATDANYKDPHHSEEASQGKGAGGVDEERDEDADLNDWLWSLIKTMRASMDHDKLYPPGQIYLLEMQQVHVTAEMSSSEQGMFTKNGQREGLSSNRAEAARIIVRLVDDVTSRFREPIFARSLFRDHLPTNCECRRAN